MTNPSMPTDVNANSMQVLRPGATQTITMTGASDAATALAATTKVVRISGDASVHYTADGTADATSSFLAAGAYEYIAVRNGNLPEFLNPVGASGFINLTEME